MKKLLVNKSIFILLILPTIIYGQSYDPYLTIAQYNQYESICPNPNLPINHPDFNKCSFLMNYYNWRFDESSNDLEIFARFFFNELQNKYKKKYPNDYGFNGIFLTHLAGKVKFSFLTFNDQTIAIAKSMGDKNYEIVVDPVKWSRALTAEKVWIMFHELAHEFFSTKHGQGGGMMFPISAGDDISLNRLWNGWDAMSDWLVSNRRNQLKLLNKNLDDVEF